MVTFPCCVICNPPPLTVTSRVAVREVTTSRYVMCTTPQLWRHLGQCASHGAHSSNSNYVPRKERRYHVKSPIATFSTTNPTYTCLGSKGIPRIDRPSNNHLSRPTATLDSFRKSSVKIRRTAGERVLYCSHLATLFQLQRRVRENKHEGE